MREWLFACSLIHNACILERQIHYRRTGKSPSGYDQIKELPGMRAADERLGDVSANVMQQSILRVEKAYKTFFASPTKYPRYTRARYYHSLAFPKHSSDFRLEAKGIRLGKIGTMKARSQRADWLTGPPNQASSNSPRAANG